MPSLKYIYFFFFIILISGCTEDSQSEIDATHYTFTLTSPAPSALLWTDPPDRLSASIPVAAVVNLSDWNNLYGEEIPNAALSVKDSRGNRYLKKLVLSAPNAIFSDSSCILDSNYSCAIASVTWQATLVPLNGASTSSPKHTNVSTIQDKALESISISFAHASNENASSLYNNFGN